MKRTIKGLRVSDSCLSVCAGTCRWKVDLSVEQECPAVRASHDASTAADAKVAYSAGQGSFPTCGHSFSCHFTIKAQKGPKIVSKTNSASSFSNLLHSQQVIWTLWSSVLCSRVDLNPSYVEVLIGALDNDGSTWHAFVTAIYILQEAVTWFGLSFLISTTFINTTKKD